MWDMLQNLWRDAASCDIKSQNRRSERYAQDFHANCHDVFFSNLAMTQIITECLAHAPEETGLVLIGHYDLKKGKWYVMEAISPGYDNVIHKETYHEVDHLYTNYEMRVRQRAYANEPIVIGNLHRHPGSMNVFSGVDHEMNRQYEDLVGQGNLSYLVTFESGRPHLWGYYHRDGIYYKVHTEFGDEVFQRLGLMRVADLETMMARKKQYRHDMDHVHQLVLGEKPVKKSSERVDDHRNLGTFRQDTQTIRIDRNSLHKACSNNFAFDERVRDMLPEVMENENKQELDAQDRESLLQDIRDLNLGIDEQLGYTELPDGRANTTDDTEVLCRMQVCDAVPHDYIGEVFGVHNDNYYYAMKPNETCIESIPRHFNSVGLLVRPETYQRIRAMEEIAEVQGYDWYGTFHEGFWQFSTSDHVTMYATEFPFTASTSRNLGIIESGALKNKVFIAIGVGSMCSYMVMQAVKSGFDHFILADPDRLEIHNLSRHWLSSMSLGRLKVEAMRDEILKVNPYAKVIVFPGKIKDLPIGDDIRHFTSGGGVVVSGGDNRAADCDGNEIAKELNLAFVSTGCFERAAAGEVFEWIPEANLPTYGEVFEGMIDDEQPEGHQAYVGEEQLDMDFVPGIWVDICAISNFAYKIALELTLRNDPCYKPSLQPELTNYTLISNTNRADCGCPIAAKFPEPMMHTTQKRGAIWLNEKGSAAAVQINFNQSIEERE